ncbi:flavodoxin domain-containing protein [Kutzneria sp. CA-103260]|uniref:flavodoxin domain-containing protein n=1 Tax=Kutzneria sp. CA-103260 TaxID=2802641 RepID=UPI001BA67C7F|nr:flavodoxin domain-containing protein [Kutzneria sp. CA-103260]QUQ64078.1 flavodoxin-like protein [Kutzneria sp. CA-103260]
MAAVLVAYASAHGSTEEIASRIAVRLAAGDADVDLSRTTELRDVGRYDAVVLGSAIHDQQWLPEAVAFTTRFRLDLSSKSLWAFSVGLPDTLPGPLRPFAMREEAKIRALAVESLHPRGHRLFSGVVRTEHFPPLSRVLFRAVGGRFGDFRDWEEIDRWTDDIAAALHGDRVTP